MEGEWSCERGGQFNGGRMDLTEVVTLTKREWSCYRNRQCNGGRMVMLQRWSLSWRKNGHVTEVTLMKGEWSCYRGGV